MRLESLVTVVIFGFAWCMGWFAHSSLTNRKPHMPPGFFLQTDGFNYRFYWFTGDYWTTNYEGGTKESSQKEAWGLYKANQKLHPWKDVLER